MYYNNIMCIIFIFSNLLLNGHKTKLQNGLIKATVYTRVEFHLKNSGLTRKVY